MAHSAGATFALTEKVDRRYVVSMIVGGRVCCTLLVCASDVRAQFRDRLSVFDGAKIKNTI